MAVNYGQVAIVPKGAWNAETQYKVNNLVSYDGSSYVAKVQPPVGTLPTDTSYWQVSAAGTKKATADSLGTVMPDGTTTSVGEDGKLSVNTAQQDALGVVKGSDDITVGEDGTLTVNTTFEQATELANIIAGEAIKSVLGKVSKAIATTMSLDENALLKNMISGIDVNDSNKVPSSAYIHTLADRIGMGTELVSGLGDLTTGLNTVNNNLSKYSFNLGDTTATDHKKIDRIETFSGGTWVNKNYNADFGGQWCFIDSFVVNTADNGYAMQRITATDGKTVLATRFCNKGTWGNWDIGATKSDLYPSYDQITLFSDVKADVTDKNITITENGMVQVAAKTQATDGTAFIRLVINGACVYEGHTVSGKYRYLWTPIFPVKKGDIIKVTLQTGTTDGQRFVYFYKS